ncbi:MAG: secretin N-terminal domain-containing protein [Phycisphaerales bacterium]|nr:secretin N-terminal domain-containing protein [Phycisphaerales bacterium]
MSTRRSWPIETTALTLVLLLSLASTALIAQDGETDPAPDTAPVLEEATTPQEDPEVLEGLPEEELPEAEPVPAGEELVHLNLQKQPVDEIIEYIVKWTGKVVMVQEQALLSKKITVMSESKVPKRRAIELLFQAFKLNDLAVVENDEMIMIDQITDIRSLQPGVVLGPKVDVEAMEDDGNIVIKVFQIIEANAQDIYDRLEGSRPDYVEMTVDVNSNQIIVEGDIGYAKRIGRLIEILDVEPYIAVKVETFRLKYADANTIADLIETLFAPSGAARATTTSSRTSGSQQRGRQQTPARNTQQPAIEVGTSQQLTVTVLEPTNSITVRAEPDIIKEITVLLDTAWDVAPSREGEIFRIYDLLYTDPIKVKDLLSALLESGGGGSAGGARGQQRTNASAGGSGADVAVANIFRIEAYPDSNRLIVISKSPSNFEWLDQMIQRIDQPLSVGMPVNIELKHASAIEVAEILNALLASAGSSSSISAPEEGLTGVDFSVASSDGGGTTGGGATNQSEITFPWQSSRGGADESAEVSAIVGKARVVPNASQNSLLVLATPEIQAAVIDIIEDLDRPGRQVMITAVLAEVELGDEFEFGLRFGQGISPANGNNAVVVNGAGSNSSMFEAILDPVFGSTFSTSILNFGVDATVILQALDQITNTRILQSPRIFTSDNKEAKFFDGKDVPFQTAAESGGATGGNVVSSFEQIAVGIGVNVRPRITREKNVAMEIEILLSNVDNTGAASPGDNPTIKRRQTNTTVTVKNGQTIVLSGIRTESEGTTKRKVPILGDIPILDLLFSSESEASVVSELVVFVTPIVVDNPDDNDVNFNELDRKRLEQLSEPLSEGARNLQRRLGVKGVATGGDTSGSDPRRD